ncbi:MAG: hypothetical protein VW685_10355, partial [Ilumatobacter sp.]
MLEAPEIRRTASAMRTALVGRPTIRFDSPSLEGPAPRPGRLVERIDAREPVLGLAVEAESTKDEAKLLEALDKLCQEDPTLRVEENKDTGQRILRGMGELHLQIQFERLQREFRLEVRAGKPDVVVRETVGGSATAENLF